MAGPDDPGLQLFRAPPKEGAGPAGLLVVRVDLAWSDDAIAACAAALAEETGLPDPLVGPAIVDGVRAEIFSVLREAEGNPGFLHTLGTLAARLDAPHPVVLHAVLDEDTLVLVESALRAGTLPLGVRYVLDLPVLRPGRAIKARVEWSRVYDHFSTHARTGMILGTAETRRVVESLVEDKVVTITAVEGVPPEPGEDGDDGGASLAAALEWVTEIIVDECCTPMASLSRDPATASLGTGGELLAVGSAFAVKDLSQRERGTTVFDLQRAEVVLRALPAQALLGDLVRGLDVDTLVLDMTTRDPLFFRRKSFTLDTAQDLAAFGIVEILGTWAWGATQVGIRLAADAPAAACSAWLDAAPEGRWTLALEVRFAPDAPVAAGQVVRLDPLSGTDDQVRLDLVAILGLRRIELLWPVVSPTPGGAPLLAVRARVLVRRGEQVREATMALLRAETPRVALWLSDLRPGDLVEVEPTWMLGDGTVLVGDTLPVTGAVVPMPAPIRWWTVDLVAEADWSDLDAVTVTLEPLPDGDAVVVRVDKAGAARGEPHSARLTTRSGTGRRYRYRTTRTWADGRVEEDIAAESDLPLLLVGKVAANVLQVEFRPLGPELPQAGLRAVQIEVLYLDVPNLLRVEDTHLVRALADRWTLTIPLADPSARAFEYRLTWFRLDGTQQTDSWVRTTERLVPVPIH